jgi:hypothetical protein
MRLTPFQTGMVLLIIYILQTNVIRLDFIWLKAQQIVYESEDHNGDDSGAL